MIAKDVTQIAVDTKDVKVPFVLKRNMVRPILMGLKEAILKKGDITILGFGRFYIYRKKVSVGIGSREKKMILTVAFKPSRSFVKAIEAIWSQKQELKLDSSVPSNQESVPSVPATQSKDTPVDTGTAEGTPTIPNTDW